MKKRITKYIIGLIVTAIVSKIMAMLFESDEEVSTE